MCHVLHVSSIMPKEVAYVACCEYYREFVSLNFSILAIDLQYASFAQ